MDDYTLYLLYVFFKKIHKLMKCMKGMKADAFMDPTNRSSGVRHGVTLVDAMIDDVQGDAYGCHEG